MLQTLRLSFLAPQSQCLLVRNLCDFRSDPAAFARTITCHSCGRTGHMARDCPNGSSLHNYTSGFRAAGSPSRSRSNGCFNCGESGHLARDCPNGRLNSRRDTRSPGRARQPRESSSEARPGVQCMSCGELGHSFRDCPNDTSSARSSPRRPERRGRDRFADRRERNSIREDFKCYNCGEAGHMSRNCPEPRSGAATHIKCFNCGATGHFSKDCPEDRVDNTAATSCHSCGELGHYARDCPRQRPRSRSPPGRAEVGVFVSNLPNSMEWPDLKDLCKQLQSAQFATHVNIAKHKDGRSRGFGVVKFGTLAEAEEAVEELDGYLVDGRALLAHVDKTMDTHGDDRWAAQQRA